MFAMWFEAIVAIGSVVYVSSNAFESFVDLFVFLPGFILLGAFIGLLNGGDNIGWWALGVPTVMFALKPR